MVDEVNSGIKQRKYAYQALIKIAVAIKNIFRQNNVGTLHFGVILARIQKTIKMLILSREEMEQYVMEIVRVSSGWLKIENHSKGRLVKINKKISLGEIVELLKRHKAAK